MLVCLLGSLVVLPTVAFADDSVVAKSDQRRGVENDDQIMRSARQAASSPPGWAWCRGKAVPGVGCGCWASASAAIRI